MTRTITGPCWPLTAVPAVDNGGPIATTWLLTADVWFSGWDCGAGLLSLLFVRPKWWPSKKAHKTSIVGNTRKYQSLNWTAKYTNLDQFIYPLFRRIAYTNMNLIINTEVKINTRILILIHKANNNSWIQPNKSRFFQYHYIKRVPFCPLLSTVRV